MYIQHMTMEAELSMSAMDKDGNNEKFHVYQESCLSSLADEVSS